MAQVLSVSLEGPPWYRLLAVTIQMAQVPSVSLEGPWYRLLAVTIQMAQVPSVSLQGPRWSPGCNWSRIKSRGEEAPGIAALREVI